jgi:hypothetical protein
MSPFVWPVVDGGTSPWLTDLDMLAEEPLSHALADEIAETLAEGLR